MKLACNLLSRGNINSHPYNCESLQRALNDFRRRYKERKYATNGHTDDLMKNTPGILKKTFAEYHRKIHGLPLIKQEFISDYLSGIKTIHSKYYESVSRDQKESWIHKKAMIKAQEWMDEYNKKRFAPIEIRRIERREEKQQKTPAHIEFCNQMINKNRRTLKPINA